MKLLLSGWSLLQSIEHRRLDQKAIAQYCGLTETTFSNWTAGATELTQIEALLRLLERLPETARSDFLTSFLRVCPTLDSPALAHDPIAVHGLRSLLYEKQGLTFIQAERDFLRSFVLGALGQSATRSGSALRLVAGLDVNGEDAFVPVPGVVYFRHPSNSSEIQGLIRAHWPLAQTGHLVLINGLWCEFPNFQQQLLAAAETRHVAIADDTHFDPHTLRRRLGSSRIPGRLLSVSELPGNRITIHFAQF